MNPKAEFKNRTWLQLKNRLAIQAGVLLLCLAAASGRAQTFTTLYSFTKCHTNWFINTNSDGALPYASLALSGNTLYGTTFAGGSSGAGTVFRVNTDGTGFTNLHTFGTGNDGSGPQAGLILSGNALYGTTYEGGSWRNGTVFRVNTDGTGFTNLHNFTLISGTYPSYSNSDGANPRAGLILSGNTLYGTTYIGGSGDSGTVFKINTNGMNFTTLHSFTPADFPPYENSDGANPCAGLILSGNILYGTACNGGSSGVGTVFKVNTDGTGFTSLYSFTAQSADYPMPNSDGASPCAGLILSGNTLYGTTYQGGSSGVGTVFKINTDGTGFTNLHNFIGAGGTQPQAGLILSGNTLYGTTSLYGTVFMVKTNGTGFTILHDFFASEEGSPQAGLILSGNTLYGTTLDGGSSDWGSVFSLSITPPSILIFPQTQTVEIGSAVDLTMGVAGDPVLTYEWFFNGTNCISCSQNYSLELTNVQCSQSGSYTVIVTNLFGSVTSAPAMLNVITPVAHKPVPCVQVMGQTGSLLNVDYANSLSPPANWTTLGFVTLTSTSQYCFDVTLPIPTQRFYRVWQTGTPSAVPSLNPPVMVPAITLTGNVGDSLELDCINQFGPTNAWVMLDTITLTNTSQLYFDVSAVGQSPRLYRMVPVP
jgi:uncharacterized repeat protein (TIGR03803 family)